MSISRFQVSNFRCIDSLDLELPALAVVVGPNGAGKSMLLQGIDLLGAIANQRLASAFLRYGGFGNAVSWQSGSSQIGFRASVASNGNLFEFSIDCESAAQAYFVRRESVALDQASTPKPEPGLPDHVLDRINSSDVDADTILFVGRDDSRSWMSRGHVNEQLFGRMQESALPAVSSTNPLLASLVRTLRSISYWSGPGFDPNSIRRPQSLSPTLSIVPSGENLFSVLYVLKSEHRSRYDELIESLRVAFPEFESMELPLSGQGHASLNWFQRGSDRPFEPRQLSDGTLRLLWLVTLLHTVPDGGVVLIDEPEISMHPQWLMYLAGLCRQMSARTQIIVATHSDQFIRWIEPSELLVADMEDGVSRFRWGHEMGLDEWLKDYTLDQLWLMGELGGRR